MCQQSLRTRTESIHSSPWSYEAVTALTQVSLNAPAISAEYKSFSDSGGSERGEHRYRGEGFNCRHISDWLVDPLRRKSCSKANELVSKSLQLKSTSLSQQRLRACEVWLHFPPTHQSMVTTRYSQTSTGFIYLFLFISCHLNTSVTNIFIFLSLQNISKHVTFGLMFADAICTQV